MKMVILLVTKMMNNTMTQGQWRIKGKIVKGEILEIGKWKVHKDTVDEYIHEINRGAGSFAIQSRLTQTQIEKRWERHLQRRYLVHEELLAMAYQYGNEKYYKDNPELRKKKSIYKPFNVFQKDGTVTAGNASGINVGAAAVILMSNIESEKRGLKKLASIKSWASCGVDPALMGSGPIPSA